MLQSVYRTVLKEVSVSSPRAQVLVSTLTGLPTGSDTLSISSCHTAANGCAAPYECGLTSLRKEIRSAFRARNNGAKTQTASTAPTSSSSATTTTTTALCNPNAVRKAMWVVKQLRDIGMMEKAKNPKERVTITDTLPFDDLAKLSTAPPSAPPDSTETVGVTVGAGVKMHLQGKCIYDPVRDPHAATTVGLWRYRLCFQLEMLPPAEDPGTELTLEEVHLFIVDTESRSVRKVHNCAPYGKPLTLSASSARGFFECTVSSTSAAPVVRGVIAVGDGARTSYLIMKPVLLEAATTSYSVPVSGLDW